MKQIGFLLIIFLLFHSCTSSKKVTTNHSSTLTSESEVTNGSSYEKAIIILERTETIGVAAEYEWIKIHYPGYKRGMQALSHYKNKPYDIITIKTSEGKEIDVYFDISNFYGKF